MKTKIQNRTHESKKDRVVRTVVVLFSEPKTPQVCISRSGRDTRPSRSSAHSGLAAARVGRTEAARGVGGKLISKTAREACVKLVALN